MTTQTGSNHYERGLELASAGKYQEGFNCIREHLKTAPQDVQALNDAGAILHCLGRTEDALGYLTKAQNLRSDSAEIIWNLVEAYLACGRAAETISLFDSMDGMGILNIDVLNRAATTLIDQGRKGPAIEVLLRSCRLWPEQQVVQPMLDVIRSKRPRIALFRNRDGEDGVLADLCDFVRERFSMEDYEGHNPGGVADLMRRCDIAWFDGGGDLLAEASTLETRVRILASLRRSDVRDRWAKDVRWENVSIVAQIGGTAVEEALMPQVPDIRNRTRLTVVPHGVNLERYALRRRERGKHLACIGDLTTEANPAFLIQCMQSCTTSIPAYQLSLRREVESPVLEQYIRLMGGENLPTSSRSSHPPASGTIGSATSISSWPAGSTISRSRLCWRGWPAGSSPSFTTSRAPTGCSRRGICSRSRSSSVSRCSPGITSPSSIGGSWNSDTRFEAVQRTMDSQQIDRRSNPDRLAGAGSHHARPARDNTRRSEVHAR